MSGTPQGTVGPSSAKGTPAPTAHETIVTIGIEAAALIASVAVAGYSDKAANIVLLVWVTLAVVWAVNYYSR